MDRHTYLLYTVYHTCGCGFRWLFPPLLYSKYRAIAIDMPGFGSSPGTRLGSRSELNAAKGGPLDIACAVLDGLNVRKAAVVGYVSRPNRSETRRFGQETPLLEGTFMPREHRNVGLRTGAVALLCPWACFARAG